MITSVTNQKMKRLMQLNQKSKARREEDVFVVEGKKMFLEAPVDHMKEVYVTESLAKQLTKNSVPGKQGMEAALAKKLSQCPYETVSDEVFAKVTDTKTPQGIVCVLEQYHYNIEEIRARWAGRELWIILENLQDPGNLGTIFRTGEGAGITGVIMSRDTVDIYNPKTIRGTMGSIYRVPFLYVDSLAEVMGQLQREQVRIYAAHLEQSRDYDAIDYTENTAFLIGNEGNGLKRETADLADAYLRIPMAGKLESLNASVAASILMYEAARQRRSKN